MVFAVWENAHIWPAHPLFLVQPSSTNSQGSAHSQVPSRDPRVHEHKRTTGINYNWKQRLETKRPNQKLLLYLLWEGWKPGCMRTQSGCPVQCPRRQDNLCHEMRTSSHQHLRWGMWDTQGLPPLTKQHAQSDLPVQFALWPLGNLQMLFILSVVSENTWNMT